MTVQVQNSYQYFEGPIAIGTELAIVDFTYIDNSHVSAKIRGAENIWEYGTDYKVEGAGTETRTLTVLRAVAEGEVLAVYLDVPITQNVSPEEGGNFPASTNEYVLDKLTYICQMLYERISRSLQVSIDTQFEGTLLNLDQNKGMALIVNSEGNGITYSSFTLNDLDYISRRLYQSIENVDTVADNIATIETFIRNLATFEAIVEDLPNINAASNYAQVAASSASAASTSETNAMNSAITAENYARSLKASGLIWKRLKISDWQLNADNLYEVAISRSDLPIIIAVYQGNWYTNKLIDADIVVETSQTKIISKYIFTGMILGGLTILNSEPSDDVATEQAAIAQQKAIEALNSSELAQQWATNLSGLVENIDYSAKYYAHAAALSETNAANSATAAASSASAASTSETNAANSATAAASSASAASTSETNAAAVLTNPNFIAVVNNLTNIATVADNIQEVITVAASLGNITNVAIASNPTLTPINGKVIWNITHEFNSLNSQVQVYNSTGKKIMCDVQATGLTSFAITLISEAIIAEATYIAVIIGGKNDNI